MSCNACDRGRLKIYLIITALYFIYKALVSMSGLFTLEKIDQIEVIIFQTILYFIFGIYGLYAFYDVEDYLNIEEK